MSFRYAAFSVLLCSTASPRWPQWSSAIALPQEARRVIGQTPPRCITTRAPHSLITWGSGLSEALLRPLAPAVLKQLPTRRTSQGLS